jgi:hypothetical protein
MSARSWELTLAEMACMMLEDGWHLQQGLIYQKIAKVWIRYNYCSASSAISAHLSN